MIAPATALLTMEAGYNLYPPESPIISRKSNVSGPPFKADGKLAKPLSQYPFDAPSIILDPARSFLPCTAAELRRGGRGTTIGFAGDYNFSGTSWKLEIKENGCWISPFHAHLAEEQWIVTQGSWVFRYFDPTGPKVTLDGRPLTFTPEGFPIGPNVQTTLGVGDMILLKRGSFFEWGSNKAGSKIIVTFTGPIMSGAINEISALVTQFLNGRISPQEFERRRTAFSIKFATPFIPQPARRKVHRFANRIPPSSIGRGRMVAKSRIPV